MKKKDATFLEQSYLKPALYVYDYKVLNKVDTGIMEIFKTSIIVQEKIWQKNAISFNLLLCFS